MEGRSQHPRHVTLTLECFSSTRTPFSSTTLHVAILANRVRLLATDIFAERKRKFLRVVVCVLVLRAVAVLLLLLFGGGKWSRVRARR